MDDTALGRPVGAWLIFTYTQVVALGFISLHLWCGSEGEWIFIIIVKFVHI